MPHIAPDLTGSNPNGSRNVTPTAPNANALRQARHRARHHVTISAAADLTAQLILALDRGGSHALCDNLPDDATEMIAELSRRLEGVKLVAFKVSL